MVESLGSWWRSLTHRNDDDEHDADDDTLDDATNALLSMLPLASIVVDEHDEVIRAHPSAYSLGVVRDDVIIEDSVLQAVREVRSFGGKKQFDLTTTTAYVAQHTPKAGKLSTRQAAKQALIGQQPASKPTATVSRPNWLKVIVGKLSDNLVVVLISDVSESVRFSQVRDSFITNVSEQLLLQLPSLHLQAVPIHPLIPLLHLQVLVHHQKPLSQLQLSHPVPHVQLRHIVFRIDPLQYL